MEWWEALDLLVQAGLSKTLIFGTEAEASIGTVVKGKSIACHWIEQNHLMHSFHTSVAEWGDFSVLFYIETSVNFRMFVALSEGLVDLLLFSFCCLSANLYICFITLNFYWIMRHNIKCTKWIEFKFLFNNELHILVLWH